MNKVLTNIGLLILAILFSLGLMFAFVELPRLLDTLLQEKVGFPGFDHGSGEIAAMKTELFIKGLHLRWIGYGSLLLILIFIIVGYFTRRSGWALAGAIGLFIPVFGQFAMSMFFLAGLGLLRVGWLPFLEISSFNVLDLGKVIYVPYWILMWFFGLFDWYAHNVIAWFFMAVGAFLFAWGVLVWFQSRYAKQLVASQWIYKISRHPQYLGWIIWSYGFILYTPFINDMKKSWDVPSSLPWLLMTMIILGICMMEELKMMKVTNGDYRKYQENSPFLIPLPKWLKKILKLPMKLVIKEEHITRKREVAWVILIYTVIFMSLSLIWVNFNGKNNRSAKAGTEEQVRAIGEVMIELEKAGDNRRVIYPMFEEISKMGQPGIDTLISLASHPNSLLREFSLNFLGNFKITKAEEIIISSLSDPEWRVRSAAVDAVREIKAESAVDELFHLLETEAHRGWLIYSALGEIGNPAAIPYLIEGLDSPEFYNQTGALNNLMKIDPDTGLHYAMLELKDEETHVRRNAVIVCLQSNSKQVIEPLKGVIHDEDFEVRFYAKQGIKIIESDD